MASLVVHRVDVSWSCSPMVYVGAITSTTSCARVQGGGCVSEEWEVIREVGSCSELQHCKGRGSRSDTQLMCKVG